MSDGYGRDTEALEENRSVYDGDTDPTTESSPRESRRPERDTSRRAHPQETDRTFDWRGWVLVAAVFFAFVVAPGVIFAFPHVGPVFGLTFWDTYLALPMIPAILLGILAVWATTRP